MLLRLRATAGWFGARLKVVSLAEGLALGYAKRQSLSQADGAERPSIRFSALMKF